MINSNPQILTLYTLNLHIVICQLYLNKAGKNEMNQRVQQTIALSHEHLPIYMSYFHKKFKIYTL